MVVLPLNHGIRDRRYSPSNPDPSVSHEAVLVNGFPRPRRYRRPLTDAAERPVWNGHRPDGDTFRQQAGRIRDAALAPEKLSHRGEFHRPIYSRAQVGRFRARHLREQIDRRVRCHDPLRRLRDGRIIKILVLSSSTEPAPHR